MGKERAIMGHLDSGLRPLIEKANREDWSGVVRLRSGRRVGAAWLVKGQLAHVLVAENGVQTEGVPALQEVASWHGGTYFLESDLLPPARSIRMSMDEVIAVISRSAEDGPFHSSSNLSRDETLDGILESLRRRVPGLESLSLSRGDTVEATTAADSDEREWVSGQLRQFFRNDAHLPERLFMQQGDHALVIVQNGRFTAVLSARGGTTPEALLWAGEEAQRRVLNDLQQGNE